MLQKSIVLYLGLKQSHIMSSIFRSILLLSIIAISFSCDSSKSETNSIATIEISPQFKKVLDAHGDWSQWLNAEAFSYALVHETNLTQESHFINLKSRKVRISSAFFEMGFDGEKTWISPNREAYSGKSIKFYHNLYFYFFSIPFVLTDPGVTVEKVEDKLLNGKTYPTFQAKFDSKIGDSPDDQYFLLINPETNQLEYLLYTVTYFGNSTPSFNALKYEDYRENNGIFFPRILTGYVYENDSTKDLRYNVSFGDVLLMPDPFETSLF
jgi:hypothetical protein